MWKFFNKDGRMIVPFSKRKKGGKEDDEKVRYVITEAYCPKGCSIMDQEHIL